MSLNDWEHKPAVEVVGKTVEHVDEGLRQYMIKVFNYMGLGLCVTALFAYFAAKAGFISLMFNINPQMQTASISGLGYLVIFAPLAMVLLSNHIMNKFGLRGAHILFWSFSAVMGLSLSTIGIAYTTQSIVRIFLITAAVFGSMSIYGYTTKRDLSAIGSILYMGVWGLVIASVVNIFMHSTPLMYAISYIAVVVFTGLTAYDIQNIKRLYYQAYDADTAGKLAISGALSLYLDFINIFISLMNIMGDRR